MLLSKGKTVATDASSDNRRVAIANRADGGVLYWLGKLYGFTFLVLLWTISVSAVSCYAHFAAKSPAVPDLEKYATAAPGVSRIYAADGTLLGEFAVERRQVVPYEDFPEGLINAFLAAEDHAFFEHRGIYFRGILRAAWANLVSGDFSQGGSTITQQVAKQFLSSDKSLDRKATEAILARRLEAKYSKKAILSLYMNQIFLGDGAYGVAAAARRYFSKDLSELDLSEMATIAGLAQAPSSHAPTRHLARARARRDLVLDKMARFGFIEPNVAKEWKSKALEVHAPPDIYPHRLPYYTEQVRRYVVQKYGKDALMKNGLRIETAVQPIVDGAAYENVDFGVRKQDKRQGWRGPEAYLEGAARKTFLERAALLYGDAPLTLGHRYLALVQSVRKREATVKIGNHVFRLPLRNGAWASPWSRRKAINDVVIDNLRSALHEGDVIWVSRPPQHRGKYRDWHIPDGHNPRWLAARTQDKTLLSAKEAAETVRLEQVPHPQAAIFTADLDTGYVLGLVGGYDYNRSVYNRAVQSCRQPGSTYKPIYYSAALDEGYGFDTLLEDKPIKVVDPVTGDVWTPENLGGTMDNEVTLEYALVFSKNVPSLHLFLKIGAKNVEKWARRLGFTTKIIADKALALGASCTVLPELTAAFATFARGGVKPNWVFVRRIVDRSGNVLEDNSVPYDPNLSAPDRLDRVAARSGIAPKQAISRRTAYLTSKLLRQEVRHGFASVIRTTGINAAGKTGTSSATMDTTFVGYTSRWITTVWMGDDIRERPLGKDDASYMTVVPLWTRYMYELAGDHPNLEIPWNRPPGVKKSDRGDHSKGKKGDRSDLIYRRAPKPEEVFGKKPGADG